VVVTTLQNYFHFLWLTVRNFKINFREVRALAIGWIWPVSQSIAFETFIIRLGNMKSSKLYLKARFTISQWKKRSRECMCEHTLLSAIHTPEGMLTHTYFQDLFSSRDGKAGPFKKSWEKDFILLNHSTFYFSLVIISRCAAKS